MARLWHGLALAWLRDVAWFGGVETSQSQRHRHRHVLEQCIDALYILTVYTCTFTDC